MSADEGATGDIVRYREQRRRVYVSAVFGVRVSNTLRRHGIYHLGHVVDVGLERLATIPQLGERGLAEISGGIHDVARLEEMRW